VLQANVQTFLFAGLYRPIIGSDLSMALAKYTEQNLGVWLTIRTYHQFMAYVVSWHWHILRPLHVDANYAHLQPGHTGAMDSSHYGGDAQLPEGITRALFMEMAQVSAILHIIFGHPPELPRLLHKGQAFSASVERIIVDIERLNLNAVFSDRPTVPPTHILDAMVDVVSARVVSDVINESK
jgi:hypothetical protein